jgi:hypothetical protein
MFKIVLSFSMLFCAMTANAQLGVMKLVGKNTGNYKLGFGVFLKTGLPVSDAGEVTLEGGANFFFLNSDYGTGDGTAMCPLKVGYRYALSGADAGFYVEPQIGYNLYGVTSLHDAVGNQINLKYHGVVFAMGTGYLFSIWDTPFDLNLRYETVIAHGGSNNLFSLGISRRIIFKKRD